MRSRRTKRYPGLVWRIPWYVAWPLLLLLTYGGLHYWANRALYFPTKYPEGFWNARQELGAADFWVNSADGVRIHGWLLRNASSPVATLFLHGNAGNVTHRYPHMREIAAAGSTVLVIDYRGYGRSGGSPGERGLYADAEAAYEGLLKLGFAPGRIVIHGESLGAAVAVDLAARRPCGGLALEAAFSSAGDVAATVLPAVGPLLVRSYDSRSKIGRVRAPILFLHGDRDGTIPLRLGQALYAVAPEPKQFWTIPGADHNDILEKAGSAYRQRLSVFYNSIRGLLG